jgi:hypothetical protein
MILALALYPLMTTSCLKGKDVGSDDYRYPPLAIYGCSINGVSPSGIYDNIEMKVDKDANSFYVTAAPHEFNYAAESEAAIDALYVAASGGSLPKKASAAEKFAFERITERNRMLEEQFIQYRDRLIGPEPVADRATPHARFISGFVHGTPSVTANKVLFGQPAGSDLSEWVRFGDGNIISVFGTEYRMVEKGDVDKESISAQEFFTMDRLLPLVIVIRLPEIPDEIEPETVWGKRLTEDELVRLTITVPVRYERYWEWCKALYSNPDAVEQFEDRDLRIVVPFVRKF